MFSFKKLVLMAGSISLLFFLIGCDNKEEVSAVKEEVAIEVDVHTLKEETYPIWVNFSGKTQAIDKVRVIARVRGELQERHFQPGTLVEKDQILFTIDKREYQAVWDQKKAILEKDKASLNLANSNVARYAPLVAEQLAPKEKLDQLIATQKQLEATIQADIAALEAARLDLEYCDVRASISGQVGKELVMLGNVVQVGTELVQIVQTDHLYVNFNPSSHEVALIKKHKSEKNPKVKVSLRSKSGAPVELEGEIDFIDNVSSISTGTVAMRAKIFNEKGVFFPGTFVTVNLFVTDQVPVLALHPDQIYQNQLGRYVYVVNSQDRIEIRQIKQGHANNDLAIILEGLKEGDRVLVGTVSGLSDGMLVTPHEVANPIQM